MKRRTFMKASAAGGVLAAAGTTVFSRSAKAEPFGVVPAKYQSLMLPAANTASSILECFMYGGISPWETFYTNDTYGKNDKKFLYTFYERSIEAANVCGYDVSESNMLTPFTTDSEGKQVFLGPFLKPLLARPDLINRMRIVINRHTLEPHEAAIPYAVSGKTLGSPALAALGAHVQRFHVENGDQARTTPYSYGFATAGSFIPNDNVLSLVATGLHPGSARPLLIKVDNAARLTALLGRTSISDRAKYDELMQIYFDEYNSQLRFGDEGATVRAARYKELLQASRSVVSSDSIAAVLDPALFVPVPGQACGQPQRPLNVPGMSLALATHLLTHPTSPAKHCCVMDTGLTAADGGGGYDTHSEMSFTQSRNLNNFLNGLLPRINTPGENNPNKIDIDKTMIILNQEFGRAPYAQNNGNGRNHWPYGYMQVYIGGPITEKQKGVYGSIAESGQATTYTTPVENRIASLLAMGIWPFDSAGFSNSEVQNQVDDGAAVVNVTKRVLGYDV